MKQLNEIEHIELLLNEAIINEIGATKLRVFGKYGAGKVFPKGMLSPMGREKLTSYAMTRSINKISPEIKNKAENVISNLLDKEKVFQHRIKVLRDRLGKANLHQQKGIQQQISSLKSSADDMMSRASKLSKKYDIPILGMM